MTIRSRTRRAVFFGVLIAQILTITALFFASGRFSEQAQAEHQTALLETAAAEAVDRMRAHLEPAESVVSLTANLVATTDVSNETLAELFRGAMERSPQLDGVFLGTPAGEFVFVSRTDQGYRTKEITVGPGEPTTTLRFLDTVGNELSVALDPDDTYDPTARPWFVDAASEPDSVAWTDPYVFFTSRQLGITTARSIVRDGELIGVVGADLELGSLSSFLTELRRGEAGGTIIVNDDGTVIAHPDTSLIQVADAQGFRTVSITELGDDEARAAVASFVQVGAGDPIIATDFETDAGMSQAAFRSVAVGDGEWSVGVFGPSDNLIATLTDARSRERWLTAAIGALSVLLVALFALPATRPLRDLEDDALTDALTGLANRRRILHLAGEAASADSGGAVAMLDIDHFKSVNDTYGHKSGDQVLKTVANRAAAELGSGAEIGRVGGEEFLIVFRDTTPDAFAACERVRQRIERRSVATDQGQIEITASIGVAKAQRPCSADDLFVAADTALMAAKSQGRNRVVDASTDDTGSAIS